jgi:hypothetical protein
VFARHDLLDVMKTKLSLHLVTIPVKSATRDKKVVI